MQRTEKVRLDKMAEQITGVHTKIKDLLQDRCVEPVFALLEDCQQTAIEIGDLIEAEEGEGFGTIPLLEAYCEQLYQIYERIDQESEAYTAMETNVPDEVGLTDHTNVAAEASLEAQTNVADRADLIVRTNVADGVALAAQTNAEAGVNAIEVYERLEASFAQIRKSIDCDITVRKEAVFLPIKASQWKALESVWKAACEDAEYDTYVIPVPYYYKNADGSFQQMQYDADLFPQNVPITRYDEFRFEEHQPDLVFIQNPYDEYNTAMSVHPFFYSTNIKKYTEKLVYIPCLWMDEVSPSDQRAFENLQHYVVMPGVVHADQVIVQSEAMRQTYVDILTNASGENSREVWAKKIQGWGSPLADQKEERNESWIPEEWEELLYGSDGKRKKVILYETSISVLMQYQERYLKKLRDTLELFGKYRDKMVVLWHAYPAEGIREALCPLHQEVWEEYEKLIKTCVMQKRVIYDESFREKELVSISDACYGDGGSILRLFRDSRKPILVQNVENLSDAQTCIGSSTW